MGDYLQGGSSATGGGGGGGGGGASETEILNSKFRAKLAGTEWGDANIESVTADAAGSPPSLTSNGPNANGDYSTFFRERSASECAEDETTGSDNVNWPRAGWEVRLAGVIIPILPASPLLACLSVWARPDGFEILIPSLKYPFRSYFTCNCSCNFEF